MPRFRKPIGVFAQIPALILQRVGHSNRSRSTVVLAALALMFLAGKGSTQQIDFRPDAPSPSSGPQIGRYQLFSGEHEIEGARTMVSERVILRLDTITGHVDWWEYGRDENGRVYDEWMPTGLLPRSRK